MPLTEGTALTVHNSYLRTPERLKERGSDTHAVRGIAYRKSSGQTAHGTSAWTMAPSSTEPCGAVSSPRLCRPPLTARPLILVFGGWASSPRTAVGHLVPACPPSYK
jgi:hypothetical protein